VSGTKECRKIEDWVALFYPGSTKGESRRKSGRSATVREVKRDLAALFGQVWYGRV